MVIESQRNFRTAKNIVDSWEVREDYLVSICEIDYNQYLRDQRLKTLEDFNKWLSE